MSKSVKKQIEVVAAVVSYEGKILCVQRPWNKLEYISKKFEFPGGKIEPGETRVQALRRELIEELDLEISSPEFLISVNHEYPDFNLAMHVYQALTENVKPILKEHIACEWLQLHNLRELDWAAADIPVVEQLIQNG